MESLVLVEIANAVAAITLNRPERHNAIDNDMYAQLLDAARAAVASPDVRAVVLRGAGPSFSSGRDTKVLGEHGDEGDFAFMRQTQELNLCLAHSPKPVIAALHGHVLGKAFETALAADIRVAARGCQLGFPEVLFGLSTDNGGAPRAAILAGPSRAKYLIMSGHSIDADLALDWGLVDFVVDPRELDEFAMTLARQLAERAPLVVAVAKEMIDQVHRAAVLNGTRNEALAELALFGSRDYVEARAANRERRSPQFEGA